MKNYKIKTSFARPEGPKSQNNTNCTNLMIFNFNISVKLSKTMLFRLFKYGREPGLIQRIFIGFDAILTKQFLTEAVADEELALAITLCPSILQMEKLNKK